MPLTQDELKTLFHSPFRPDGWKDLLRRHLGADQLLLHPQPVSVPPSESERGLDGTLLGEMETDGYRIGLFDFTVPSEQVKRRRVGLRNLLVPWLRTDYDAALVTFHSTDPGVTDWRVSFICDLKGEETAAKRFTFVFGDSDNAYRTPVTRFLKLAASSRGGPLSAEALREAFSVEALSKEFYTELFDWFEWAVSPEAGVTFPNNPDTESDDRENIQVKIIRLITRLLFVWFIRQKRLVPDALFDPAELATILKDFDPRSATDGKYYNAILQNLFFGTLNTPIYDDETGAPLRAFAEGTQQQSGNLYRYAEMFAIPKERVIDLFSRIPYMNGGLFECLDKPRGLYPDEYAQRGCETLYDGFSRNAAKAPNGNFKRRAFIPNELFFADEAPRTFTVGDASETRKVSGLLRILQRYNFTVEENTPTDVEVSLDPELLGRVFENLLASYNPETRETARHSTGSFYTPREIVDYMVEQTLGAYMAGTESLSPQEAIARLKAVKILDPACGSGAFPMGCLIRITDRIEELSRQAAIPFDRYRTKLDIINNCIYGVDIQPIAMMISKLRFFISLICEQDAVDDDPRDNFGIKVLPNLETKFVAANTLLTAAIRTFEPGLLKDPELLRLQAGLMDVRRSHFDARKRSDKLRLQRADKAKCREIKDYLVRTRLRPDLDQIAAWENEIADQKRRLRTLAQPSWRDMTEDERRNQGHSDTLPGFGSFDENPADSSLFRIDINEAPRRAAQDRIQFLERAIAAEQRKALLEGFDAAVDEVTQWRPYDQVAVSPFFDPEWMFGLADGFDIVLGNPPWIQLQDNHGELAELYKDKGYSTFVRTGDIYCLFYELGLNLLAPGGILAYITSNKWMRIGYGKPLRKFLTGVANPLILIDLGGAPVFENVTADPCILVATKEPYAGQTKCMATKTKMDAFASAVATIEASQTFDENDWVILSGEDAKVLAKMAEIGKELKDYPVEIDRGILTGYNTAFYIDGDVRDRLVRQDPASSDVIQPLLRGRDIRAYHTPPSKLWLINIHNGLKTRGIPPVNIRQYPAIKRHLDQFFKALEARGDKGDTPYNLRNCAYLEAFSKPKIIYPNMTLHFPFTYDKNGAFTNDKAFILTSPSPDFLKYLVGVLNSRIAKLWIWHNCPALGEDRREIRKVYFEHIPIPDAPAKKQKAIAKLVDRIIAAKQTTPSADTTALESQLDTLVYRLYNLTPEEIAVVENQQ